jgi:tryptophan synthase alpha chain
VLEHYIRERRKTRDILLMTHIVLGYPSFEECDLIVDAMVSAGVDLMELQIPFSEPVADGPVIVHANQVALARGSTLAKCFAFAERVAKRHPIPFLLMSYYNPAFRTGVAKFVDRTAAAGLRGAIIPDLPPEEGAVYLREMNRAGLDPIFIYSPTTPSARMRYLAESAKGFVYCVARKGITGSETQFSADLDVYLSRCRTATELPLALGFGVQSHDDIAFLRGKVDIAVVGSQTLRLIDSQGVSAVLPFISGLRG